MTLAHAEAGDRRWFVLMTGWNKELLARENLLRQGIDSYCPMRLAEIRPRGRPAYMRGLPFFPRYLFVNVDMGVPGWRSIYGTRGVTGVLPSGDKASAILAKLVEDIRKEEVGGYVQLAPELLPCPWKPGDPVCYGAVRDAIFQERVDERRALILVSLLGRSDLHLVDIAHLE